MTNKWNSTALGMLTLVGALTFSSVAVAQEVTLRSSDGTVNMTGEFVDFRDNSYVIATALGELRVSASRVQCEGAACPDLGGGDADVKIGGSDTVGLGLMPLLLEGYAGSIDAAATLVNTGNGDDVIAELVGDQGFGDELASILVNSTGSSDAFSQLLDGEIEVGMSSRRIVPDEARALRSAGAGNMVSPSQEHIVAIDSLVMITNPSNPVETLTTEQVRQVYSGQVTNWSELGGPDMPITVVARAEDTGTRAVFEERIFGETGLANPAGLVIAGTNSEVSQIVNQTDGAIGYVGYAFQRGANALSLVNECGIAMAPDAFSARTEEYALQRRLYLYTREDTASDRTTDFINYATSEEADSLIGKAGFIGFAVDRRPQSSDGDRARALLDAAADPYEAGIMRDMLDLMVGYDRLSTTFRFRTGSSQLDERGRIDKDRLIDYLAAQPAGTQVMMVGFTDDVGQFDGNLDLSRSRAAQVADEVREAGGSRLSNVTFASAGYGEIAPSGCNTSDEGRRINRRVEVWIQSPA
ncbi:phosphate ABC transporter substrate-binding/OmpA family protein [Cognatiyoonia sp. IB215182]|uniref:phosphate ABC transporter substrate-binding/OmpA family protein n=1 Tax=Cognatiyoonia sp. IB215182 TaxID=3097353 RepID=UPI002A121CC8|nr:phosphate ABC transporter substrate-binding/OmpA family protein [Cognatiyoonia sp. IB215182]MDX8355078.1 phosphate ABC transporter substrate-binding/OmpA family protein [Cognatiyoonia sp. IB215182]